MDSETDNAASRYSDISCVDIANWWSEFAAVLRLCYTPNRADLEIPLMDAENFQEWAYSAAAEIMANADVNCREKVVAFVCGPESEIGIRILMMYMEELATSGTTKSEALSRVLREVANPKNGKYRNAALRQAMDHEYQIFCVNVLKDLIYIRSKTKSQPPYESIERTITNILWFMSALAANDSGFASKVRQMLKVKFFHHDLLKKMFFGKTAAHYPLLKILRQLSKSGNVSQTLGKDSIMSTIRKMFTSLTNQPGGKLLLLVDSLTHLTKDKTNSLRFLKAGLLVKMIRCFSHWELWRGRGLLRLSKSVISIYNHIGQTKQGKKALVQCDAVINMRKFFDSCPMEKAFDDVIMKGTAMLANCYEKDKLPLINLESPIKFDIPDAYNPSKFNDSGSSSDDEGSESEEENAKSDEVPLDDDDSSESDKSISDDEIDLIKSPSESLKAASNLSQDPSVLRRKREKACEETSAKISGQLGPIPIEKLVHYNQFFLEFKDKIHMGDSLRIEGPKICSQSFIVDENDNETARKSYKSIPTSEHTYTWAKERPEWKYWTSMMEIRRLYAKTANEVNSVAPFVKIAYPEFAFGYSLKISEAMLPTVDRTVLRSKLSNYNIKIVGGDSFKPKVVYCLDDLMSKKSNGRLSPDVKLSNSDEKEVGNMDRKIGLQFESRFESGNLRKAIQTGEREYDLVITSDVNSRHHNQWFYFQISNMCDDLMYTFNIINCTKGNSLFNYGMQPVVFSVVDAMKGSPGWVRSGSKICYYKNGYKCVSKKSNSSKVYHTLSFNLTFSHRGDIVYVAYHIPYTYTRLMVELNTMMKSVEESKADRFVRYDILCQSLNNNEVPVLTITSRNESRNPVDKRKIIFLTSRVHPGETNASWVMKGILEYLLFNSKSIDVLKKYVFKIVPMLNVEGVINGCHRCGLTSEDLNRCWKYPSEILHPTIYHSKMLIEYTSRILTNPPIAYIDLHGHSRRKNLFFYGCSFSRSWNLKDQDDDEIHEDPETLLRSLPERMARISPAFCLTYCNYDVRKSRETTARVAVWRDYQILRSYTLECSYCGCDRGTYKGVAFGTIQLLEIGKNLCQALENL